MFAKSQPMGWPEAVALACFCGCLLGFAAFALWVICRAHKYD